MKALNADPEFKAATSARMKALNADPEFKAATSARMKALHADPEFAAKRDALASARMKALNADKLAWCPPELIEDYRLLVRHLGADEAREAIEHQLAHEQVIAVCPQCDRTLLDPACRGCTLIGCPIAKAAA
jgi:hypothetical protein